MTAIYDYTAKDAHILAGTLTMFKVEGTDTTYTSVQGVKSMIELGSVAPTVEQTSIEDTECKRYMAGLPDSEDLALEFFDYGSDTNQQALKTAALAKSTVFIEHQWPSGDVATYKAQLLGWKKLSGGVEDPECFSVSFKKKSAITWGTAAAS